MKDKVQTRLQNNANLQLVKTVLDNTITTTSTYPLKKLSTRTLKNVLRYVDELQPETDL